MDANSRPQQLPGAPRTPEAAASRCFLTGASGFVGSHLAEELIAQGHTVRALLRTTSSLKWIKHLSIECAYGDVTDPATVAAALDGADYVFHVAGLVKALDRETYFRVNAGGTASLLDACARMPVPPKRIVLVSSQAAGGPSGRGPAVTEDDPPHPISFYGESKAEAERVAAGYSGRLPITIVRPPAIYGPRDTEVFQFIKAAYRFGIAPIAGKADAPMSTAHVHDVVQGLILAAKSPKAAGRTYYVAGPDVATWDSVIEALEDAFQKKLRRVHIPIWLARVAASAVEAYAALARKPATFNREKIREILADGWVCSIQRAREELAFEPRITVRQGMRDTVDWCRQNGWI